MSFTSLNSDLCSASVTAVHCHIMLGCVNSTRPYNSMIYKLRLHGPCSFDAKITVTVLAEYSRMVSCCPVLALPVVINTAQVVCCHGDRPFGDLHFPGISIVLGDNFPFTLSIITSGLDMVPVKVIMGLLVCRSEWVT